MGHSHGVLEQQHQQRQPKRSHIIPFPPEKGCSIQQQDHHGGPYHRRSTACHEHEHQSGSHHHKTGTPAVLTQQRGQESRQKSHMHSGHGSGVAQSAALQG